jgi:hypothetical protein
MEAQHVGVFNGVGDGVGVQLLLEQVGRGAELAFVPLVLLGAGVGFKNGRAGKAKKLGLGEKRLDGLVVVAKLGAVAFVKDEDDALVAQRRQLLFVGGAAGFGLLLLRLLFSSSARPSFWMVVTMTLSA